MVSLEIPRNITGRTVPFERVSYLRISGHRAPYLVGRNKNVPRPILRFLVRQLYVLSAPKKETFSIVRILRKKNFFKKKFSKIFFFAQNHFLAILDNFNFFKKKFSKNFHGYPPLTKKIFFLKIFFEKIKIV